jgi:splicing factor 45
MAPDSTPAKGGLVSLYANLLDPSAASSSLPGTISRAPVVFKQDVDSQSLQDDAAAKKQQISAGRPYTLP